MNAGILTEEINEILIGDDLCEKQLAEAGVPSEKEIMDQIINGMPPKHKRIPDKRGRAEIEAMIPSIEKMKKMFVGGE